jgi:hypothetical protein
LKIVVKLELCASQSDKSEIGVLKGNEAICIVRLAQSKRLVNKVVFKKKIYLVENDVTDGQTFENYRLTYGESNGQGLIDQSSRCQLIVEQRGSLYYFISRSVELSFP